MNKNKSNKRNKSGFDKYKIYLLYIIVPVLLITFDSFFNKNQDTIVKQNHKHESKTKEFNLEVPAPETKLNK